MGFEVLPPGATCSVTVDVVATGVGSLGNTTNELLAVTGGELLSSGKAGDVLEVTRDDIHVQKEFLADPVPAGEAVDGEVEDYAAVIVDGDAGNVRLLLELPGGTTQLIADSSDLAVRHGAIELFRAAGGSVGGIDILATAEDDTIELGNLAAALDLSLVPLTGDGFGGFDTLKLIDSDQDLPLADLPGGTLQNMEAIDVRGNGAKRLSLTRAVLTAATDANDTLQVFSDPDDAVDIGTGWTLDANPASQTVFIDDVFFKKINDSTLLLHGPSHWQNPVVPTDVSGDGNTFAQDVIILINAINAGVDNPLPTPTAGNVPPFYLDPTGDGNLFPADVITVINFINSGGGSGEGEAIIVPPLIVPDEPTSAFSRFQHGRSIRAIDKFFESRPQWENPLSPPPVETPTSASRGRLHWYDSNDGNSNAVDDELFDLISRRHHVSENTQWIFEPVKLVIVDDYVR